MMSMYEGQEEDDAVVIPNAFITPGMSHDPCHHSPLHVYMCCTKVI